jgi:hypothetical protein
MYQADTVLQQAQEEWQQLQSMNYEATQPYIPEETEENDRSEGKRKKEVELYDRIAIQWLVMAEIGFILLTFIGVFTFICFLRVFGAGLLAGSVGLVFVLAAIIVLLCFWNELNASDFKLRVFACLFACGCALAVAMSDQAVDLTRHYWALLQAAVVVGGVTTIAAGALVMAIKYNSQNESN